MVGRADFPTIFISPQEVTADLGSIANDARESLANKGYFVATGLTPAYAARMAIMGAEPDITEYCPKDSTTSRFGTEDSARSWQAKGDSTLNKYGRAMFLLMRNNDRAFNGPQLVGYGWTGPELAAPPKAETILEDPEVVEEKRARFAKLMQGCDTTFAVRIGQEGAGNRLAVPFTQIIVAASNVLYGAQDMWLETWKSNHAGPKVYAQDRAGWNKLDIEFRATRPSVRAGKDVEDDRTYYIFPNQALPNSI